MEICRISNMPALPPVKARSADIGPVVVTDIENFVRIDDETYSSSGGKSASGAEDEALEEELEEIEDGETEEGYSPPAAVNRSRPVNFFA